MLTVYVPAGVPVFPPALCPPPPQEVGVIPKHTGAASTKMRANLNDCSRRLRNKHTMINIANKAGAGRRFIIVGAWIPWGITNPNVRVVVVIVAVEVPEPFGNDEGAKLQLTPPGNPVQESATLPLNALTEVTVMVDVAEPPEATDAGESAEAEIEKSGVWG